MRKKRRMKVYYAFMNEKEYPFIRLIGKWLKECNFEVGDEIEISYRKELLLIRKVSKEENQDK